MNSTHQLNLGCGDRYVSGWWNVDLPSCPHGKDQEVDLTGPLPWDDGQFTFVYAGHVLEHMEIRAARDLCARVYGKVALGGSLLVVGPDCDIAQRMAEEGTLDVTMASLVDGGHRWPGDEHRWRCTGPLIGGLLEAAGWTNIRSIGIDAVPAWWPVADRGPKWQCAVLAVKLEQ